MEIQVRDKTGQTISGLKVDDSLFGAAFKEALVHQVMVGQRANRRQGTADTKTRGEVRGSTRKLYRQKGTGRARQGSIRAPHRRKGGIVFGPHPRDYSQALPKKMRRQALRCVLSAKAAQGELVVVDRLDFPEPKTKEMRRLLEALGISRSALLVTAEPDTNVVKSARNLPGVGILPAAQLNVVDLLTYKTVVMTSDAVRKAEALWGAGEVSPEQTPDSQQV